MHKQKAFHIRNKFNIFFSKAKIYKNKNPQKKGENKNKIKRKEKNKVLNEKVKSYDDISIKDEKKNISY